MRFQSREWLPISLSQCRCRSISNTLPFIQWNSTLKRFSHSNHCFFRLWLQTKLALLVCSNKRLLPMDRWLNAWFLPDSSLNGIILQFWRIGVHEIRLPRRYPGSLPTRMPLMHLWWLSVSKIARLILRLSLRLEIVSLGRWWSGGRCTLIPVFTQKLQPIPLFRWFLAL